MSETYCAHTPLNTASILLTLQLTYMAGADRLRRCLHQPDTKQTFEHASLHCLHVPSEHESLPPDDGEHHAQSTSTGRCLHIHTELPLAGATAPHGCTQAEKSFAISLADAVSQIRGDARYFFAVGYKFQVLRVGQA